MHVAGGLSLEQTTVRARELHLADVSAVALFKRLSRAGDWLQNLCEHLLREQQLRLGARAWPSEYKVRAIERELYPGARADWFDLATPLQHSVAGLGLRSL